MRSQCKLKWFRAKTERVRHLIDTVGPVAAEMILQSPSLLLLALDADNDVRIITEKKRRTENQDLEEEEASSTTPPRRPAVCLRSI